MNKNLELAIRYFKDHFTHLNPASNGVLNLSRETVPFPVAHTRRHYFRTMHSILPFENQSFDFVYGNEPTLTRLFHSPLQMVNEFSRVSVRGGWLEFISPIQVLVLDTVPELNDGQYRYVSWTDMHTQTLCLLPYAGSPSRGLVQKENWESLVRFNALYLKNFFTWTHPLDIHLRMHTYETQRQYDLLFDQAMRQSAQHTQFLLENYS